MQKKTCPNGHVYDQSIYGDTCPLCPPASANPGNMTNMVSQNTTKVAAEASQSAHTRVSPPNMGATPVPQGAVPMSPSFDPTGSTHVSPNVSQQVQNGASAQQHRTVIRHNPKVGGAPAKANEEGRKLVGFLVTYNRTPMGKAYNIYEGRNVIGRDESCDIAVTDDNQMSGRHMSIRYLSGNNKFRFHDEMSSNGTYVNKELQDDGELENYDIIRVGSTLFIFIAIPQI